MEDCCVNVGFIDPDQTHSHLMELLRSSETGFESIFLRGSSGNHLRDNIHLLEPTSEGSVPKLISQYMP